MGAGEGSLAGDGSVATGGGIASAEDETVGGRRGTMIFWMLLEEAAVGCGAGGVLPTEHAARTTVAVSASGGRRVKREDRIGAGGNKHHRTPG
jgi:hypothetical protein